MRSTTAPGPGSGSGNDSTAKRPGASMTAARTLTADQAPA